MPSDQLPENDPAAQVATGSGGQVVGSGGGAGGANSLLIDHFEKRFADNYRKEIDQEENVWRTLPFFAATLALEVTALTQLREQVLMITGAAAWVAVLLSLAIVISTVMALYYLVHSIAFAEFKYISSEPELLTYLNAVEQAEKGASSGSEPGIVVAKRFLARQYAATTDNNRAINQHRAKMRTTAGFATLASVLATLALGAFTVIANLPISAQLGGPNVERPQAGAPSNELLRERRPLQFRIRPRD